MLFTVSGPQLSLVLTQWYIYVKLYHYFAKKHHKKSDTHLSKYLLPQQLEDPYLNQNIGKNQKK